MTEPVQQALALEDLAYQKNLFLLGLEALHEISFTSSNYGGGNMGKLYYCPQGGKPD